MPAKNPYDNPTYKRNRKRLLADHPMCCIIGCGKPADTADHIIGLAQGGDHSFENLQPMCLSHNAAKGARYGNATRKYNRKPNGTAIERDIEAGLKSGTYNNGVWVCVCKWCELEFTPKDHKTNGNFCSRDCAGASRRSKHQDQTTTLRAQIGCSECGEVFEGHPNRKTCGQQCQTERNRKQANARYYERNGRQVPDHLIVREPEVLGVYEVSETKKDVPVKGERAGQSQIVDVPQFFSAEERVPDHPRCTYLSQSGESAMTGEDSSRLVAVRTDRLIS